MTTMMGDSGSRSTAWNNANPGRSIVLNDLLDACHTMDEKRALYTTFTKEEQNGLIDEYVNRSINREAPAGALVKGRHERLGKKTFDFVHIDLNGASTRAGHDGLGLVICTGGHGSRTRHVMLMPPWVNAEGMRIVFATTQLDNIEEVK